MTMVMEQFAECAGSKDGDLELIEISLSDIHDFLALQAAAYNSLGEDSRHYMKLRTYNDLAAHIGTGQIILGLRCGEEGALVAQGVLTCPADGVATVNLDGYPFEESDLDKVAIVQGLSVNPSCRGMGLSGKLINAFKDAAAGRGRGLLVAKIADGNKPSVSCFKNAGFTKRHADTDPKLGHPVSYWGYDL